MANFVDEMKALIIEELAEKTEIVKEDIRRQIKEKNKFTDMTLSFVAKYNNEIDRLGNINFVTISRVIFTKIELIEVLKNLGFVVPLRPNHGTLIMDFPK